MTVTQQIVQLSSWQFWLFFLVACAICAAGFYFGFRSLFRARVIENTPTAKIRSAQQGYVELTGSAELLDGQAAPAPLTGIPCCWYRFKVEKKGDKNWRTVDRGVSGSSFLLRDDTGECVIDPKGAEITASDRSVWYGSHRVPAQNDPGGRARVTTVETSGWGAVLNQKVVFGGRYRYTEERIRPGDALYAIGLFKSQDDIDFNRARKQKAGVLLREWKRDKGALLARFDLNGDGSIDTGEWERARQAAVDEAGQAHTRHLVGISPHSLGDTGSRRRPFLVSTLPQFDLVRRFRLRAGGGLAAFFVAGTIAAWMLGTRLAA